MIELKIAICGPKINQLRFLLIILALLLIASLLSFYAHPAEISAKQLCEEWNQRTENEWVWDGEGCK
jgi:hypothetical protein